MTRIRRWLLWFWGTTPQAQRISIVVMASALLLMPVGLASGLSEPEVFCFGPLLLGAVATVIILVGARQRRVHPITFLQELPRHIPLLQPAAPEIEERAQHVANFKGHLVLIVGGGVLVGVGVAWLVRLGADYSGVFLPAWLPLVVGVFGGSYIGYRILCAFRRRYPDDFPH